MQLFNTSLALKMINNMKYRQKNLTLLSMQLATGNRLVSPSVDPAGFAISQKMKSQIRGLEMASRNSQDAISMFQRADGALDVITSMVQRIHELTLQAANGTNEDSDIKIFQEEISQLLEEIGGTPNNVDFNNQKLFDGSKSKDNGGIWIQTGANAGQGTKFYINKVDLDFLGLKDFDITGKTSEQISSMVDDVKTALKKVTSERSRIGSYENRLGYTINYLENSIISLSDANSRICDTDMAKTMMQYIREQTLMTASIYMLANLYTHEQRMISMLFESLRS